MAEHDSGIANSFTDLMTSLAVIFILLLCASLNNAFEEGQDMRVKILEKLQIQLKEYVVKGVKVKSDPNDPLALLILVPEGLLEFQLNKANIPARGDIPGRIEVFACCTSAGQSVPVPNHPQSAFPAGVFVLYSKKHRKHLDSLSFSPGISHE